MKSQLIDEIHPRTLYLRRIRGDARVLIDVRSPEEFAEQRVARAKNMPMGSPELKAWMARRMVASSPQPAYVMCLGGVRSAKVCRRYEGAGLVNVQGGIRQWDIENLPLEGSEAVSQASSRLCLLRRIVAKLHLPSRVPRAATAEAVATEHGRLRAH